MDDQTVSRSPGADEEPAGEVHRVQDSSTWIHDGTEDAAEIAAQEAEGAGVSPHAVMRSAVDGYATGLGDRWEGIHRPADPDEGHQGTGTGHPDRVAAKADVESDESAA